MILIVGNSVDAVEPVMTALKRITDEEVLFFRADLCLEGESVGFSYLNGTFSSFVDTPLGSHDLSLVRKGWFWKPMLPKALRDYEPHEDSIFIYRQFLAVWRSLTSVLPHTEWLNDYYRLLEAEHKPYQLQTAARIGFKIPDTLVTSDPERASKFWVHCNKEMVIKTIAVSPNPHSVVFTNRVTDELMGGIDRIKSSPVILQKLITPKEELRITVVGDDVFPAVVESESPVDWRRGLVVSRPAILPAHVQELCKELVRVLGLQYGCIDMIVDNNDEYYFLEINPNGQWKFVEERAGLPIGEAIARLLSA